MNEPMATEEAARRTPRSLRVLLGVVLGFAGLGCFGGAAFFASPLGPILLLLGLVSMACAVTSFYYSAGQSIGSIRVRRRRPSPRDGIYSEPSFNRVESQRGDTMAEKLIVYTTPNCSACDNALRDLTADGVDFEERNVMKDKAFYDEALQYSITVPILIQPDGKVAYGWKGNIGCAIC
jgi:glutaredoxin